MPAREGIGIMFNIGFSELILILLVAFLIVGPKDLPRVARSLGRFVRFLKEKWAEFVRETDMGDTISELKGVEKDLKKTIQDAVPATDLSKTAADTKKALDGIKKATGITKPPA